MSRGRFLGRRVLALLVIGLLFLPTVSSVAGQEPHPLFRSSPARTGEVNGSAPFNNTTLWSYDTTDPVKSSPIVHEGKVYVGTMGGEVLCLDAFTGQRVWTYTTEGPVESSSAVIEDRVYIGSDDTYLYCLDATDGSLLWKTATGGEIKSSPLVRGGQVYVGSNDFKVYCFDAIEGEDQWIFETGGYVYSSPSLWDDTLYFGSCDGKMYAVNASKGNLVWNYTADFCPASPAITEEYVIFGAYDGLLHYLNRTDGKQVHSVPVLFAEIYSSAGLFTWGESAYDLPFVFVATTAGKMVGIGPDGKEFWNRTHGSGITSSPLIVTEVEEPYDPFIVYGDEGGRLHGIEIYNPYATRPLYVHNYVEWHIKLGSSIQSSPFVWHKRVYVGVETADGGGMVVCIGGSIGENEIAMTISDPFPRFGRATREGTVTIFVNIYNFKPDRIDVWFDGSMRSAKRNLSIEFFEEWPKVWSVEFPATRPEGPRFVIARAYQDDVELISATGQVMSLVEGWDTVDLTVDNPTDGEVITDPIIVASGHASSNYSIEWVRYYWDDPDPEIVFGWHDCSGTENWTAAIETHNLDEGWHDLTFWAGDDYRNSRVVISVHIGELEDEDGEVELIEIVPLVILFIILVALFRTKPPRVSEKPSSP